ncbi:hypothetical protein ACFOOM_07740 [Streptomyces echinoruber]|uniref:Uncharacterized protein n=1 Tax=Streptomyces echinoruber TaxID=68898 RepID=A0A918R1R1_9ACTN|nr:hypothetical protein [Streptomyces echinoruber]GGZ80451.1 hypothetical protein GCM10010389_17870 [Streptomyces echinoruber]
MRRDPRLTIITEALQGLIPGATPALLTFEVKEARGTDGRMHTWTGRIGTVAERVYTALYGRPDAAVPASPLQQAEDAKARRDIVGEVAALTTGYAQLTTAPWHPSRQGDLVHIHYPQAGDFPAFGETYIVGDAGDGLLSLTLLSHTFPADDPDLATAVGCFASEASDEPLMELWFEAGPHLLTIVRDGQVVHHGAAHGAQPAAAGTERAAQQLVDAIGEAIRYLERGEPELALARLCSPTPLPPCGTPGMLPDHAPCARPRGHHGACSPDADYAEPPHQCPALPEQLHAVVAIGPRREVISFAGLYEDQDAALDVAAGWDEVIQAEVTEAHEAEHEARYVFAHLPAPQPGRAVAVVAPVRLRPDPRAEDEWAAEGAATSLTAADIADDFRDVDE